MSSSKSSVQKNKAFGQFSFVIYAESTSFFLTKITLVLATLIMLKRIYRSSVLLKKSYHACFKIFILCSRQVVRTAKYTYIYIYSYKSQVKIHTHEAM